MAKGVVTGGGNTSMKSPASHSFALRRRAVQDSRLERNLSQYGSIVFEVPQIEHNENWLTFEEDDQTTGLRQVCCVGNSCELP